MTKVKLKHGFSSTNRREKQENVKILAFFLIKALFLSVFTVFSLKNQLNTLKI